MDLAKPRSYELLFFNCARSSPLRFASWGLSKTWNIELLRGRICEKQNKCCSDWTHWGKGGRRAVHHFTCLRTDFYNYGFKKCWKSFLKAVCCCHPKFTPWAKTHSLSKYFIQRKCWPRIQMCVFWRSSPISDGSACHFQTVIMGRRSPRSTLTPHSHTPHHLLHRQTESTSDVTTGAATDPCF